MKARLSDPTLNPLGPVVLFGLDQHGRPKAARFPEDQANLAVKAAEHLQLQILRVTEPGVAEIAAQLPVGRIHANGKGAVPNVRGELYEKLVTAASLPTQLTRPSPQTPSGASSKASGSNSKARTQDALPKDWDEIAVGHLVIAQHQEDSCWYEANVVEQNGDMFSLRWRDWRWRFTRHRHALALLFPNSDPRTGPTGQTSGQHLAKSASETPSAPKAKNVAHGLPLTWNDISVDHLVLAKDDGPWRSWWEAIPTENQGDTLTLRWRDYAQLPTIVRPRLKLALMYPGLN